MQASADAGWRATLVIHAAPAANLGIAVAKFMAAAITGSSSMPTKGVPGGGFSDRVRAT